MPGLSGLILILIPSLLFGLSTEGNLYLQGSMHQDVDVEMENQGIFGGTLKLFNDVYYFDIGAQGAVPFDSTGFESNVSIQGETYFPWGGTSAHIYYQDGNSDFKDYITLTGEIYRTVDNPRSVIEYGDILDYSSYPNYNNFDHFDNTLYLLYKIFFRKSALHTYFDFSYRAFIDRQGTTDALTKTSTEIYCTRGIKRNIGSKYGIFINKNITSGDSLIYIDSDLFDAFAYDEYKVYLGFTIYHHNILLKPELSFKHKIYNALAEENPYTENGFTFSLYADCPLNDHLFIYSNNYIQMFLDQSSEGSSYKVTLGMRYVFAK